MQPPGVQVICCDGDAATACYSISKTIVYDGFQGNNEPGLMIMIMMMMMAMVVVTFAFAAIASVSCISLPISLLYEDLPHYLELQ